MLAPNTTDLITTLVANKDNKGSMSKLDIVADESRYSRVELFAHFD